MVKKVSSDIRIFLYFQCLGIGDETNRKISLAGISTELLKSRETARRIAKLRKRWEEWWEKGIVFLGWSGITVQRREDIRFATPRVQNISEEARESQLLGFIPTIPRFSRRGTYPPSLFQRSSCHHAIRYLVSSLITRLNHDAQPLKIPRTYDRWSPFQERWMSRVFLPSFSFFFSKKEREKERERKKGMAPIRYHVFFIARKLSNLNSTSVPTPLKFRDSGTPTYARHPGQWNRKSERKKRPAYNSPFLYSAWYYKFCFSLLPGNVTSNEMKPTG